MERPHTGQEFRPDLVEFAVYGGGAAGDRSESGYIPSTSIGTTPHILWPICQNRFDTPPDITYGYRGVNGDDFRNPLLGPRISHKTGAREWLRRIAPDNRESL